LEGFVNEYDGDIYSEALDFDCAGIRLRIRRLFRLQQKKRTSTVLAEQKGSEEAPVISRSFPNPFTFPLNEGKQFP